MTDLDGKAIAGRKVAVRAERLDWEQVAGEWKETVAGTQECPAVSAAEAVRCTFTSAEGGVYRIVATVADDQGRPNETEMRIWVAGGKAAPRRGVEQEEVTLVPDRKEYKADDVAEVLVLAPFLPAEGLVTVRRSGILRTTRFTMAEPSHILRIPIEEGWTPNVHVQVDLVGSAPRTNDAGDADSRLPKRPAFASGSLSLPIPPRSRTLDARGDAARDEARTGRGDGSGRQPARRRGPAVVGADVAVMVVDEAVLALTGYRLPDPIEIFYSERTSGVTDVHSRASVLLAKPGEIPPGQDLDACLASAPRRPSSPGSSQKGMAAPRHGHGGAAAAWRKRSA